MRVTILDGHKHVDPCDVIGVVVNKTTASTNLRRSKYQRVHLNCPYNFESENVMVTVPISDVSTCRAVHWKEASDAAIQWWQLWFLIYQRRFVATERKLSAKRYVALVEPWLVTQPIKSYRSNVKFMIVNRPTRGVGRWNFRYRSLPPLTKRFQMSHRQSVRLSRLDDKEVRVL